MAECRRWIVCCFIDILIDLGEGYHFINRLVSMQDYLALPKYESDSGNLEQRRKKSV
jgi:hypothetical protein